MIVADERTWKQHFQIQSVADLDFVIGQMLGWPIGMSRNSPPEFRRRVLAAAISYQLQLRSIDYALKRYVNPQEYDEEQISLGDATSDYLARGAVIIEEELRNLHTKGELPFGLLGAELTLYKIPYTLDTARILSNRGLLLEILPILRLCLEMMSWAAVAFELVDEEHVATLKAQSCIFHMKRIYRTTGRLYGYLSQFTHWGHIVHGHFIAAEDGKIAVLKASVRYRAMGLSLCLVILDAFVEVIRHLYKDRSDTLVLRIQGTLHRDSSRKTSQAVSRITELSGLDDIREIQSFLS
jgi:hypothetical protein